MTPIANGPARNTPRGRTRIRTRAGIADTVPAGPGDCRCHGGRPITIGRFVDERLVDVELRHLRSTGCGLPSEHIEPRVYQADIRR
ncbi:hypothetical protein FJK98_02370 [Micromonospora sp. HM134]|uniref:hypothetical protein n=1 Tax=Micromonospora sp. HM134 TaxID=2583243 RepID=UPI0011985DAE|nr:hypothetical protein [Micromonospora sp. HM134]QDY06150.1 hypothetical protein FJK98_02370 [Micromonospora sp. HM134]